jgi:hypothetical protein
VFSVFWTFSQVETDYDFRFLRRRAEWSERQAPSERACKQRSSGIRRTGSFFFIFSSQLTFPTSDE